MPINLGVHPLSPSSLRVFLLNDNLFTQSAALKRVSSSGLSKQELMASNKYVMLLIAKLPNDKSFLVLGDAGSCSSINSPSASNVNHFLFAPAAKKINAAYAFPNIKSL